VSAATRARPIRAPPFLDPSGYARHRPEATLLYRLVEQHFPAFRALRSEADRPLPDYIEQEFDAYLKCGRLELGFLRLHPAALTQVLGVVYRTISGYLLKRAELPRATGHTGAVTLIQRFGSALNLNIHFHMLFLDGVYLIDEAGQLMFRHVPESGAQDLQVLVEDIAGRIGRTLERCGLIERDMENTWLADITAAGPLDDLLGHSITYRIAVGPRAGQKLFTLQTVSARLHGLEGNLNGAATSAGFSLHAGIDIQPGQRAKLERLCRYVSRPPVATERLGLTSSGQIMYELKTPYRDGTTHILMEPLDLMARLAALVLPPRMHLTRFHGVFAPHSRLRAAVTPAHRGIGAPQPLSPADAAKPSTPPPCCDELGAAPEAGVWHRD